VGLGGGPEAAGLVVVSGGLGVLAPAVAGGPEQLPGVGVGRLLLHDRAEQLLGRSEMAGTKPG
jgi:hypothetical protein